MRRAMVLLYCLMVGSLAILSAACGKRAAVRPAREEPRWPPIALDTVRVGKTLGIRIEHPAWDGHSWECRIPEYLIIDGETSERLHPSAVKDTVNGTVTLFGAKAAPDSASYEIVFHPSWDSIDIEATVANLSERPWDSTTFGLCCLVFAHAPAFFDKSMTQTFVHSGGKFLTVDATRDSAGIEFKRPKDYKSSANVLREEDVGWRKGHERHDVVDCSLIVRSSTDGHYCVAQAWQDAFNVSYNLDDARLNCMHSNPRFTDIAPGDSRGVHGRIYFFWGTIDALYEQFLEDFPNRGYGAPTP